LDFDYHWQYSVRLLYWVPQLQKQKLVIVDTRGTIATTDIVVIAIRDIHRGTISPGMSIPGIRIRDAAASTMDTTGSTGSMEARVRVVAL
jgi:hypothetical protein